MHPPTPFYEGHHLNPNGDMSIRIFMFVSDLGEWGEVGIASLLTNTEPTNLHHKLEVKDHGCSSAGEPSKSYQKYNNQGKGA